MQIKSNKPFCCAGKANGTCCSASSFFTLSIFLLWCFIIIICCCFSCFLLHLTKNRWNLTINDTNASSTKQPSDSFAGCEYPVVKTILMKIFVASEIAAAWNSCQIRSDFSTEKEQTKTHKKKKSKKKPTVRLEISFTSKNVLPWSNW